MKTLFLSTALVVAAPFAQAASITFQEQDFASGALTSEEIPGFTAGAQTVTQSTQGNPGTSAEIRTVDNASVFTAHFLDGAVLTSANAQVTSFDFSIDFQLVNAFGAGMAYGMVIEQNGEHFVGASQVTGIGNAGWQTFSTSGLLPSQFFDLDASPNSTQNGDPVDVLDAGLSSTMRLGFYTANSGGAGITVRYDNVSITANGVTVPPAVPLPGGMPLLLAGMGALALYRRKAARRAT